MQGSGLTSTLAGLPKRPYARVFHLLAQARGPEQGFDFGARLPRAEWFGEFGDPEGRNGDDSRIALEDDNVNLIGRAGSGGRVGQVSGLLLNRGRRGDTLHETIEIVGSECGVEEIMTGAQRFDGLHRFP